MHLPPLRIFLLLSTLLFAGPGLSSAEDSRAVFDQWVESRRILSAEQSRWREEEAFLQQSISWMERELELLTSRMEEAEETVTAAESRRVALLAEQQRQQLRAELLSGRFADLEREIREMAPVFPPVLLSRVRPLLDRMAAGAELPLPQRAQNIIGILNEINRFNRTVTLAWEVRSTPEGRQTEVRTIYIGLAQAYFVDDGASYAGYGRPSAEGWIWTAEPAIAGAVARAVAIYSNDRQPEFVPLPVGLR